MFSSAYITVPKKSKVKIITPLFPLGTSDFKQLTNQELWERRLAIAQFGKKVTGQELTQNEIDNLRERHIRSNQGFYDYYLKMFLCSVYPEKYNFDDVDMNGLKHFQWVIVTNKSSYNTGEPVGIRLTLKNISDTNVTANYNDLRPGFMLNSIRLERLRGNEKRNRVFLTVRGCQLYQQVAYEGYGVYGRATKSFQLSPGDEAPTNHGIKVLNSYYDLSEPGEYELTFYTRNYLGDDEHQIGEYPKPCTIRFKIEQKLYEPEIKWPDDETVIE